MELRALKAHRTAARSRRVYRSSSRNQFSEIRPHRRAPTHSSTPSSLDHWIEAAKQSGAVAIWPETSTVAGTRPALAGIALALAPGLAAYVPVGHHVSGSLDLDGPGKLSLEAAIERLRPLLEDPGVLKIGHDVKTAAHLLSRYGIAWRYDFTMLIRRSTAPVPSTRSERSGAAPHELTPKELTTPDRLPRSLRAPATSRRSAPMPRCGCTRC
jgi:hypothetical protein